MLAHSAVYLIADTLVAERVAEIAVVEDMEAVSDRQACNLVAATAPEYQQSRQWSRPDAYPVCVAMLLNVPVVWSWY